MNISELCIGNVLDIDNIVAEFIGFEYGELVMHWYNDEDDLVLTWDEYNTCYAIVAHNMLRYSDEFAHHVVLDYVRDIEKGDYIQLWEGHLPI